MEEQNSNAYSEALAVLKLLDDEEKLEKLPIEMLEVLKSKANPEYKPEFSKDIPIDEQNISPEALGILSWIAMKYWGEAISIEENSMEQITENSQNIKEKIKETTKDADSTLPVLYKDLKWYQKIRIKIIEFFNKILKKHNVEKKNNEEEGNTL